MAKVFFECPDLLFGSKVEGALRAAGHEISKDGADVAVVDLTEGEVAAAPVAPGARLLPRTPTRTHDGAPRSSATTWWSRARA